MLTICSTFYNRTKMLCNYLLPSLMACDCIENISLSFFDFGTPDFSEEYIRATWPGKVSIIVEKDRPFHKPYALNKTVENSSGDLLFFCDADMTVPKNLYELCVEKVSTGHAWFPICFSLYKDKPPIIASENGNWRGTGYGMCGITREDFKRVNGYDLKYCSWGGEDNDFHDRCAKSGILIERSDCPGLFHNWHPTTEQWHKSRPALNF